MRTCVILGQYPLSDTYKGARSSHNQNNFYPPLMWTSNFTSPLSCDAKLNKLLLFKTYLAAVYCSSACGLKYSLKGRQRTLILRGHRETLLQWLSEWWCYLGNKKLRIVYTNHKEVTQGSIMVRPNYKLDH